MAKRATTAESEEGRQAVVKAISFGGNVESQSTIGGGDESNQAFTQLGALCPPYDPLYLCHAFEHSNSLRSNVDAYATNIDGFGHRFEPILDFEADDIRERVRQIIATERAQTVERLSSVLDRTPESLQSTVSDEEITERIAEYRRLSETEKVRLQDFFEFCCSDHSFVELRKQTRQDLEVTGNAYWEVLRDGRGDIARFVYVPSYTVRLMPIDGRPTAVSEVVRVGRVRLDTVTSYRCLRRYVQVVNGLAATYMKSLDDPRFVSRKTGRAYATVDAFRAAEPDGVLANELVHFKVHSPSSPYGVPRWIGNLISVLGSRSMEEINYLYFDNKSVPPLAILVSGGHLNADSVPRIENFIEENLKGKTNFHKILLLEAEGQNGNGQHTKIELRPLTEAQQKDALFAQYDERNIDKVGSSFRLPPLIRGDGRDFNRSVADAQLRFAEDQVFQPERDDFDFMINRRILLAMGVRFWRFRSQTNAIRDPERLTEMVAKLTEKGILTPGEARDLSGDILNRDLKVIKDDWTKRPITLTLAGIQTGVQDLLGKPGDSSPMVSAAKQLIELRDQLEIEKRALAERRMELARKYQSGETETLKVPRSEWDRWFEETPQGGAG
jgi:PBSX family phage portal protein